MPEQEHTGIRVQDTYITSTDTFIVMPEQRSILFQYTFLLTQIVPLLIPKIEHTYILVQDTYLQIYRYLYSDTRAKRDTLSGYLLTNNDTYTVVQVLEQTHILSQDTSLQTLFSDTNLLGYTHYICAKDFLLLAVIWNAL